MAKSTKKIISLEKLGEVYDASAIQSSLDTELTKLADKDFSELIDQIDTEFKVGEDFIKPKWDEWTIRLKLMNNQRRDKQAIGDPLLFSIFQTLLASLYDDKMGVTFGARERGDEETSENVTGLANFDYDEMGKSEIDYYWDWDTLFFGRGLVLLMDFDRKLKCPLPLNIDPLSFIRDPRARSVNGDKRGRGALRFWGYEERMTRSEMKAAGTYFNINQLGKADNDYSSLIDQNRTLRDEAQGRGTGTNPERYDLKGDNKEYRITKWFTYYKGKRVMVHLALNRKKVIRFVELPDMFQSVWPLVDRACFPMSNDWDGVSIPDLVEDKQRARAVATNLALKGIKANLHPRFIFNTQKIKRTYLLNSEINNHIPSDGDPSGAIVPVQRQAIQSEVNWILGMLDSSAQRSTATPEILQGQVGNDKRTATEIEKVSRGSDTRYSLAVKIWGWSEKMFWQIWYLLYKENFAQDIDEKVIRINGANSNLWRKLLRDNIISNIDPDVVVESKILADAKRQVKLQGFTNFANLALSFPGANKLFTLREIGLANGVPRDLVYLVIPETQDELLAREENKQLDENKKVEVGVDDDHVVHIELHNRAAETPQKFAHVEAHKTALRLKKTRPDLFSPVPSDQMPDQGVMEKISSSPNSAPVNGKVAPASQMNNGQ